ncbi:hypothetical protein NUW54_g10031 [Trametes sanguinea]|uniref:Uncharacterized protein n=1 Tax=Trametes sanguinea TaxID=158606 RepID=A0ACC1P238_9APHY|nr:hypothetical protein NUW54_g10031 [Trametes sanguinea]
MDRTMAHLALAPTVAYGIEIKNAYGWPPLLSPIGSTEAHDDGILGFGLPDLQGGFENEGALGFLAILKDQVDLAEEDVDFLTTYLALRFPHPSRLTENWLAWNNWPTINHPAWYSPIRVLPGNWFLHGANPRLFTHWTIPLIGMKLVRRTGPGAYANVWNGDFSYIIQNQGSSTSYIPVILDTGSSLSYVSPELVNHIRTHLFPCQENRLLGNDSVPGVSFIVRDEHWDPSYCMEYHFQGTHGDVVIVHGEADPFLCTHDPTKSGQNFREGLVCVRDVMLHAGQIGAQPGAWLFGVNFFQTMYVALCKPHNMSTGDPYVKLATQWQNDLSSFALPRAK